jgi:hypothetical protein
MRSNCRPQLGSSELKLLKIGAISKFINWFTKRDKWSDIFRENTYKIPGDNGIKTSTLDYNGERDLSSIIKCVILRLWGSLLLLFSWFGFIQCFGNWMVDCIALPCWLYWADCTDSWCSPNASSPLYIASYIYDNACGRLDLCLVLNSTETFLSLLTGFQLMMHICGTKKG